MPPQEFPLAGYALLTNQQLGATGWRRDFSSVTGDYVYVSFTIHVYAPQGSATSALASMTCDMGFPNGPPASATETAAAVIGDGAKACIYKFNGNFNDSVEYATGTRNVYVRVSGTPRSQISNQAAISQMIALAGQQLAIVDRVDPPSGAAGAFSAGPVAPRSPSSAAPTPAVPPVITPGRVTPPTAAITFPPFVPQTPVPTPAPTLAPTQTPQPTVASFASVAVDRATVRAGDTFGVTTIGFPDGWETNLALVTSPTGTAVGAFFLDPVPIRQVVGSPFIRYLRFFSGRDWALGTYTLHFYLNSVPYLTTIKLVQ